MDRFKLEIFKKESEKDFTFYKTLSMEESSSFLNELSVQFHVQCENFNILQNIGEPREDMNAASDEFQVERLLKIGLMFLVMMISANTFLTSGTQS